MLTDDQVIEYLMELYEATSPILYKKKTKDCRKKLLKLIKKIRKDGLESVLDESYGG